MTWDVVERIITWPWRVIRWFLLTRPIRFTRFGFWYICFTLAVGAAAINTGNNLLYLVLGILLGSIVVSGILSDSSLWQVTTTWTPPGTLYAGRRAIFDVAIEKGRFPGLGMTVLSTWQNTLEAHASHFLYWLAAGTTSHYQMSMIPIRRGWLTLKSVRYSTHIPFGFFEKFHVENRDETWLVYPAFERLTLSSLQGTGAGQTPATAVRAGTGSVPFDLRNFRTGDSIRQIHWRSSAKRRRLLVHEMEEETDAGSWLTVSAWPPGLSASELDHFITFIASVAFTLIEHDRPVGLLTPDLRIPPAHSRPHFHRLLRYLALVVPSRSTLDQTQALSSTDHSIDLPTAWRRHTR